MKDFSISNGLEEFFESIDQTLDVIDFEEIENTATYTVSDYNG